MLKIRFGSVMRIHEFRIPMPLSLSEYEIGSFYTWLKTLASETGGGEGVKFLETEPYRDGHYRTRRYYLSKKAPPLIRRLLTALNKDLPLVLKEESWTTFPTTETVLTSPVLDKDKFYIRILTVVKKKDNGDSSDNVFALDEETLHDRTVEEIDIADIIDVLPSDYSVTEDPTLFRSKTRGYDGRRRGPVERGWFKSKILYSGPMIMVYKLVTCLFGEDEAAPATITERRFLDEARRHVIEDYIQETARRILAAMHRRTFCWFDKWSGLSMRQLLDMEKIIKPKIDDIRKTRSFRGTRF